MDPVYPPYGVFVASRPLWRLLWTPAPWTQYTLPMGSSWHPDPYGDSYGPPLHGPSIPSLWGLRGIPTPMATPMDPRSMDPVYPPYGVFVASRPLWRLLWTPAPWTQ